MSPEQQLYNSIRRIVVDLFGEEAVFPSLPDEGTDYPFVVLGEEFGQKNRDSKDSRQRYRQLSIHIYHNDWRQQGTVRRMIQQIDGYVRQLNQYEDSSETLIPDDSTNTRLVHGIYEINLNY